jgi:hypothetical protein
MSGNENISKYPTDGTLTQIRFPMLNVNNLIETFIGDFSISCGSASYSTGAYIETSSIIFENITILQ